MVPNETAPRATPRVAGNHSELRDGLARDVDAAYEDFILEFQNGIYSGVRRLVPAADDAEDITQDVFVRAYRALTGYAPERIRTLELRAWLWTIALNACRNAARGRRRRPTGRRLEDANLPAGTEPGPEDVAIERETSLEWQDRLMRLPDTMRTAVVLRHVAGLGYGEMARVLDRPAGSVKADVHRGLRLLREVLAAEEGFGGDG